MKYKNPGCVVVSAFKEQGQQFANGTKQPTHLYDDHGIARFVLAGWPMRGTWVATFWPAAK